MPNEHVIHLANGRFAGNSNADSVRTMLDAAVAQEPKGGIAVHFHGGLVSESKALKIADRLGQVYEEGSAYPIFFVWESGLIETLKNNFGELAQEKLFRILFKRLRKIVKRKFRQSAGARTAGLLPDIDTHEEDQAIDKAFDDQTLEQMPSEERAPADLVEINAQEEKSLAAELEMDAKLRTEIEAVSAGLLDQVEIEQDVRARAPTVRASSETLMDPKALEKYVEQREPGSRGIIDVAKFVKGVVLIASRVIKRFVDDSDHGLHATIIEELLREFYLANIGQVVWSTMKKDTEDSFGEDRDTFGGTAFLQEVNRHAKESDSIPRLTLIGHSTGAVYICHLLKKADELNLPNFVKFDVIFLAPAVTFALTAQTLSNHQHRIGEFRMFTMTDVNELKDTLVPVLYPHSLLYFVSGVVEKDADTPIVGMERYYRNPKYGSTEYPDVLSVRQFVGASSDRAVWSVDDRGAGLASSAKKHGDFDEDSATLGSIKHILASGL